MPTLPPKLIESVKKNNLVIFVGAGTSFSLKNQKGIELENWSNLVRQIILHVDGGSNQYGYLLEALKHQAPITVLDLIEKSKDIEKKEVYNFIKEFFELHEDNNYELHKKITKLCNIIITTNYDTAFENSNTQLRNRVAYRGKNYELTTHKDNKPLLFKLHGCFSDIDSMVLFPSNYDSLYVKETRDTKHTLFVLKNLVFNKNILFIGCGMGDFQINHIFREIKEMQDGFNQPHFILSKQRIDSLLDFLTPISIAEHQEINGVLEALLQIKEEADQEKEKDKKQLAALEKELTEKKSVHKQLIEELFEEALDFRDEPEKACKKYEQISRLEEFDFVYNNWGTSLGELAGTKSGAEAEAWYVEAFGKYRKAVEIKPNKHEAYYGWGTYLGRLAGTKQGPEAEALYVEAFGKYEKAVEIKPDMHEAYHNWGTDLGNLAGTKQGPEAEAWYVEAFGKYEKAVGIKPDDHEAYYNWGIDLSSLAATKQGAEAEAWYVEAFGKYEKAVEIKPDKHEAYNNWGNGLGNLAGTKQGPEAEALYVEAFGKYEKAVTIKPDDHEAYHNWGTDLGSLAGTKQGPEAEALYVKAFGKYEKAVEIKPDDHEAYYNWGTAMGRLAGTKQGPEAEALYVEAFGKYEKAIEIKPDKHEAYHNWGNDLSSLAAMKQGAEAEALYQQAFEKYQKSMELGGKCYNLACWYAVREHKKDALLYLAKSLEKKEIKTAYVADDPDWKGFAQDEDFQALLKKHQ